MADNDELETLPRTKAQKLALSYIDNIIEEIVLTSGQPKSPTRLQEDQRNLLEVETGANDEWFSKKWTSKTFNFMVNR